MTAYYNENDPKVAAWLRELIRADVIVSGEVDERDIRDVVPTDLDGFTQCHFFAGIGGWPYALRLAGWPDTREVWTGSCPCQPFSAAGKRAGTVDERHLWPAWHWIIHARQPPVIFGEQVASPDGLAWLDLVQADLEGSLYEVEYADLCAAGVGAPHIRQRLFWVAESVGQRRQGIQLHLQPRSPRFHQSEAGRGGSTGLPLGDAGGPGLSQRVGDGCLQREALESLQGQAPVSASDPVDLGLSAGSGRERVRTQSTHGESVQTGAPVGELAESHSEPRGQGRTHPRGRDSGGDAQQGTGLGGGELFGELGDPDGPGARRDTGAPTVPVRPIPGEGSQMWQHSTQRPESASDAGHVADAANPHGRGGERPAQAGAGTHGLGRLGPGGDGDGGDSGAVGFWSDCQWIFCRDSKYRPAQSGIFPLAARLPGSVGRVRDSSLPFDPNNTPEARTMRLRGYGNSIVPQLAAEFICAYLETES